jgi:bacillithiol biosynthesis deacetylase BshB1
MSSPPLSPPLDVLAIAAHRDDVEQTCGGTLLKAAQRGQRTGILDLTQGEMGTRGTAEDRAREADDAAKILGVSWRRALDLPDGRVENTWENRLKVASVIRQTRPRVIILPYWKGRHPDHYTASVLSTERRPTWDRRPGTLHLTAPSRLFTLCFTMTFGRRL